VEIELLVGTGVGVGGDLWLFMRVMWFSVCCGELVSWDSLAES